MHLPITALPVHRCIRPLRARLVIRSHCKGRKRQFRPFASSPTFHCPESFGGERDDRPQKSLLRSLCRSLAVGLAVFAWLKISAHRPASLFCSASVATASGAAAGIGDGAWAHAIQGTRAATTKVGTKRWLGMFGFYRIDSRDTVDCPILSPDARIGKVGGPTARSVRAPAAAT